ncbi:MAG TPA: hypothetical protein VLM76_04460 [Patescibacteria group bacterium]|nr:hypothetical protein [Patescibacteria group bacterium]
MTSAPGNREPSRLPPPAASFIREHEVQAGGVRLRAGIDRPAEIEGWWLAVLWVADDEGIVPCRLVAPAAGPPPDPPHVRLGQLVSGSLSGFVLEDGGRQQLRLRLPVPPAEADRPWSAPLVVQLAVRWEPARAAGLSPNKLADLALAAFRRAVEAVSRP